MKTPNELHVSIIIPLSDHTVLNEIIHALAIQIDAKCSFETILIDSVGGEYLKNMTQKVCPDEAKRCQFQVHSIPSSGRGSALNEGIRRASGDLYIFLGDDFIPRPAWLKQHVDLHLENSTAEIVGLGPSIFPDHLMKDRFVQWLDESGAAFGTQFRSVDEETFAPMWFYGANTSIKPSLLWRAGLFDDDFPYDAIEDFELGRRLFRLGMNIEYLPKAMAIHEHPVNLQERISQYSKVGESVALFDAKYTVGEIPKRNLWKSLVIDELKKHYWKIACNISGRRDFEERFWKQSLNNSYQQGYVQKWSEISRKGMPQRRMSSAFQSWMEKAVEAGELNWNAELSTTEGLYPFLNEDGQFLSEEIQGKKSLKVINSTGTQWTYFRVEPIFAQYLSNSIELECRVFTSKAASLWIEYDSTDKEIQVVPGRHGAFKSTEQQKIKDGWSTCRFSLPDFCCQERINGGDFRIACWLEQGEEFYLQSVKVIRKEVSEKNSISPFNWLERMGFKPVEQPKVSVIIPIHNHLLYTLQCLQSLAMHSGQTSHEVIVVDDASTDLSRSTLAAIPGLKLVPLDENLGFTGACNRGAEAARGELLLFLNNDTVAMPGWLDEMVAVFDSGKNVGVVGSRLIYPQTGELQHIGVGFDEQGWPYHFSRDDNQAAKNLTEIAVVPAVTGACFLTPRDLFNELGAFEPIYTSECQDIDYCLKVARTGLNSYYCGRSILLHYESVTRKELDREPTADMKILKERWFARTDAA